MDQNTKPVPPVISYSPEGYKQATGLPRTHIYEALASGALKGKKGGRRTIITFEEGRRYINDLPDRPTRATAQPGPEFVLPAD